VRALSALGFAKYQYRNGSWKCGITKFVTPFSKRKKKLVKNCHETQLYTKLTRSVR
jgi:uncharacterized protein YbcV (DUF1398 family)